MYKKLAVILLALGAGTSGWWLYHHRQPDMYDVTGQGYRWQDLHGRWLVINYFARWCAPCLAEIPALNRFNQQLEHRQVRLLAISWDPLDRPTLLEIKRRHNMGFTLLQNAGNHAPVTKPDTLPTTYIVGPQGQLRMTLRGEQTSQSLWQALRQAGYSAP